MSTTLTLNPPEDHRIRLSLELIGDSIAVRATDIDTSKSELIGCFEVQGGEGIWFDRYSVTLPGFRRGDNGRLLDVE